MELLDKVIDSAQEVLKIIGPGYGESVYEEALAHELRIRGIAYERQRNFDVLYKGYAVGSARADLIVNPVWAGAGGEELVLELKTTKNIQDAHKKQAQVYMASLNIPNGAVLSFSKEVLVETVSKPERKFETRPIAPKKCKGGEITVILRDAANEVYQYLGTEILYYGSQNEGKKIYTNAIGVELRLNGIEFVEGTYNILYKNQVVDKYTFDFVFSDRIAANIFVPKKDVSLEEEIDELSLYKKLFNFKKCYLVSFPNKENGQVTVAEV
ncbi:MAG: GxxExxY protein [candidate division WOR-3 bacterium]